MILETIRKNKLVLDFVNYFSGRLLTKGIVFLSIPIFSRLLLPDEFGVVSLFFSLFLVSSVIIELNLSGAVRQYVLKDNSDLGSYLFSTLVFVNVIFALIIGPLLVFFSSFFSSFLEISRLVFYLLILNSFSNIFIHYYEFYLLGVNNSRTYSMFSFLRAFIEVLISILFIVYIFQQNDIGRIGGIVTTYTAFGIYSLCRLIGIMKGHFSFKWEHVRFAALFGMPLILHQVSHVVLAQIDRIVIKQLINYEMVGLYSMAYSLGMVMQIVVIAFNSAWLPKFYEHMADKAFSIIRTELVQKLGILVALSILASIALREIAPFVVSSEYSDSFDIIHIVIMASVLNYVYLMYANYSFFLHKTWFISLGSVLAGAINISLNYCLIPNFGYKVAAWTTVVSYLSMAILHYIIASLILKQPVVSSKRVLFIIFPYGIWVWIYTSVLSNNNFIWLFEITSFVIVAIVFLSSFRKWRKL